MTSVARERYDDIVDAITGWHPHCRASKVFGMPCVKRSGRVVFGLARTGMVFKLTDPAARARALSAPGAHLFDPSGRGEAFRQCTSLTSIVIPNGVTRIWGTPAQGESLGLKPLHSPVAMPVPGTKEPATPEQLGQMIDR